MTTNFERAADLIYSHMSSWDGESQAMNATQALADAGLLMPEMREPDNDPSPHYLDGVIVALFGNAEAFVSIEEYDNLKVVPDGEEVYIALTHRAGNRMVYKTYGKYFNDPSLEDARKEALDMLAALDWIEKNSRRGAGND